MNEEQVRQPDSHGGISMGGFIPPHGGYQDLLSYQRAVVVYDANGLAKNMR
jgi:hypothetical protein